MAIIEGVRDTRAVSERMVSGLKTVKYSKKRKYKEYKNKVSKKGLQGIINGR